MNLIGDSNVCKDFKKTTMMLHCLGTHKHVHTSTFSLLFISKMNICNQTNSERGS